MIVKLPSGDSSVAVDLRGMRVRNLSPSAPRSLTDLRRATALAVDRPLDGAPLSELLLGSRRVTVVVPDTTRQADLPAVLPVVLERTLAAGVAASDVTVLVACGTHPAVPTARLAGHLGELPAGVEVVQHEARDAASLVAVGEVAGGLAIRLHRRAVDCDRLITVGGVRHHYFAGFGGGPKLVFPGVAGYEEIQANHSRVVRRTAAGLERDPRCEPGVLEGNPVAEEIAAAADLRPPDLAVASAPGIDGHAAMIVAGSWRTTHDQVVARVRTWYEVAEGPEFDLVVASAGGAPTDSTLIQAHKALDAACRFARPGAEVLFVADLGGGPGSADMAPFLREPSPPRILEQLATSWVQYGHTTLRLLEKTSRFHVHLVSRLDPEMAARLGFRPASDVAAVVDSWRDRFEGSTVAVMPGQAVYPGRS